MFLPTLFFKRAAGMALLAVALSPAAHASAEQEAANKAAVLAFYEKGLNQKDADAALKYVGDRYVQHNPSAADGPEGFRKFIAFLRDKFPKSHSEIKRVFTDGDYVILHVHAVREPGARGSAIIDIFRLEQGKIVEHWDAVQPIPEQAANSNGMF
ncbi:polyketide cyclase [Achromobacter sp. RTa]|nr:polyketide cyclase [Achromobacter sp. RTa]